MERPVRVGLLGCGNVGSAVVRMLHDHAADIRRRAGMAIEVSRVAVRDPSRDRGLPIGPERFTAAAEQVVRDEGLDVVVEVMGGVEPARSLVLDAFRWGKSVVTANKELLATHGAELLDAAREAKVELLYEASVGGGIPLIRPLREHLAGDRIVRFIGIVNGTTNYVLTRMTEDGLSAGDAVAEARALGYAEADPSADLDGHDAAAKAAILGAIAFDVPVRAPDVYREGIRAVSADDVSNADRLGYVIKLLAIGEVIDEDVAIRVHPAMLPREHPLASVRESFNAVFVEGERVGPLMLYGRGAGGDPTATSVVGDLIELARRRGDRGNRPRVASSGSSRRLKPLAELPAQYYVLMEVADRPGVLASVASTFARHDVSIKSVRQEGRGDDAQLVLITHRSSERALRACVDELRSGGAVKFVRSALRVVGDES